jgi:ABC-type nitrate/sulfonate/bicarbonate transport system substrate-binding protein
MRGKRISYQKGIDDSIATSLINFANITPKEMIFKPKDFSYKNFINDEVDIIEGYISDQPYQFKKKYGIEVNVIDPKNYGIDFYGDLLFTTEKEIAKHPKRVKAFTKATLQGWAYALSHQDETIATILKKYNTQAFQKEQLQYEAQITENLIAAKYITLGDAKKERFSTLAKLYQERGLTTQVLQDAVDTIIYDPNKKSLLFEQYRTLILSISLGLIVIVFFSFYTIVNSNIK